MTAVAVSGIIVAFTLLGWGAGLRLVHRRREEAERLAGMAFLAEAFLAMDRRDEERRLIRAINRLRRRYPVRRGRGALRRMARPGKRRPRLPALVADAELVRGVLVRDPLARLQEHRDRLLRQQQRYPPPGTMLPLGVLANDADRPVHHLEVLGLISALGGAVDFHQVFPVDSP